MSNRDPKQPVSVDRQDGRVTRAQVAREAGVSLAVVTYALNGGDKLRIAPVTRRHVQAVAARLGYRPRFMHRALAAGKTYTIGLIVPEQRSLLFPFYELIIGGLVDAMNREDYDPLLLFRSRWERIDQVLTDGRVDGLIFLASDRADQPIERLAAADLPLVVVNRDVPDRLGGPVGCVYSDHKRMVKQAVQAFVDRGRRRLLNFGDPVGTFANACRDQAFHRMLDQQARHGVSGATIVPVWDRGRVLGDGLFKSQPRWDGVLADGDRVTDAVLKEAARSGLVAGRDFDVINVNSYVKAQLLLGDPDSRRPVLRGYLQQSQRLGERAWEMLKKLMEREPIRPKIMVPYIVEAPFDGRA